MRSLMLARVIQAAGDGGVDGRKRLQKVVYLLQRSGFEFDAAYRLHFYGPYSRDVAECCDALVRGGVVAESEQSFGSGSRYRYVLSKEGRRRLGETPEHSRSEDRLLTATRGLLDEDLRDLELASTILFFHDEAGHDWPDAVDAARSYKEIRAGEDDVMRRAEAIARRHAASRASD